MTILNFLKNQNFAEANLSNSTINLPFKHVIVGPDSFGRFEVYSIVIPYFQFPPQCFKKWIRKTSLFLAD